MSFSFGNPNTTGNFSLSTPTTSSAIPGAGLNFAGGDNKTPQTGFGGGGIAFGATPTANTGGIPFGGTPTANTSGIAFGGTPTANTGGGIAFGGTPTANTGGGIAFGGTPTANTGGGIAFGGTPTANAGGGIAFGGTPTTNTGGIGFGATPAANTGGLAFGAAQIPNTGGFQLGGTPTSFAKSPAAPNVSFNLPTTTPTIGAASSSALAGFTLSSALGQTPIAATTAPTLALGTPATSAPAFNLSGAATTSASTGFSLGGISSTGLTLGTPATTTTTSAAGGFTLGKIGTPTSTAAASTGLSLSTTTAAPLALTSTATITPAATVPVAGFTFAQLEEALNKWTLELEDQGKMFINQALQLNAWDRLVIANGEKILTLNNGIEKVKQQQQQLDHELDFVLAQQRELEECIIPLEKELKDIPITDQDRNHTYQMAENMDTQLKQMSEDLKEIIEHLNESNKTEDSTDPVAQIGRILNAHMNSLQWIDRNTAQIGTFLDQITKMHDMHRRDNERSFHLTYE